MVWITAQCSEGVAERWMTREISGKIREENSQIRTWLVRFELAAGSSGFASQITPSIPACYPSRLRIVKARGFGVVVGQPSHEFSSVVPVCARLNVA